MEVIASIEGFALGLVAKVEQEPYIYGILIIILLLGIASLILRYKGQKWALKCHEEQRKLNVRFEDQMLLLGRFHEDLVRLNKALSTAKEVAREGEDLESSHKSISSLGEAEADVSAAPLTLVPNDASAPSTGEGKNYAQEIEQGKRLIEKRVKEIARELGIEIAEVDWYKKPSMLFTSPYILMVSTGDKPKELGLLGKEITEFSVYEKALDQKLKALIDQIKHNSV